MKKTVLILVAVLFNLVAVGDEPSFERRIIDQAIKDLRVFAGAGTEAMQSHVVMRWPNNVRGTKDGATVLLTQHGIPKAACCIYTWQGNEIHYGFGSLSSERVSAEVDGESSWHPTEAGVKYRVMPGAPEPANQSALRLRQMRQMSRRFATKCVESSELSDELRLIPKPVYRYQLDNSKADAKVVDGAVFAFVQGTDPEAFLLIEARRSEDRLQWEYTTAKRTVGQIDVSLDGKLVHIHKWGGWNPFQANAIFTTLKLPIKPEE